MRWLTLAVAAYVAFALEAGVGPLWQIGGVTPSVLLLLAAFVALWAHEASALWAAVLLGVLTDLLPGGLVVGPHALGFALGAWLVVRVRGLVFRQAWWTIPAMTLLAGVAAYPTAEVLTSLRLWWEGAGSGAGGAAGAGGGEWPGFWSRLGVDALRLVYTAVLAAAAGWLLDRSAPWWRFATRPSAERRR